MYFRMQTFPTAKLLKVLQISKFVPYSGNAAYRKRLILKIYPTYCTLKSGQKHG